MDKIAHAAILYSESEPILPVIVTSAWREAFPDARVGLLVLENVLNPPSHPLIEQAITRVEATLREQFAGADRAALLGLPEIQAYQRHYRTFGQTYHVLRQLETVALKGKSPTSRGVLVQVMFATELQTRLLTAGHDLDAVEPPITIDCSSADEQFIGIGGQEHALRAGDMLMRDLSGIISAVVYGPDQRTRLTERTRRALFSTYAPAGIDNDALRAHLTRISELVKTAVPSTTISLMDVFPRM